MVSRGNKKIQKKPQELKEPITVCPVCGAVFKSLRGLNKHLTGKHGVKILRDIGVIGGG